MSDVVSDELCSLAARVIGENAALGRKVAVAESCTGGLVGAALTEVAGSSAVFERGFVTYSNEAKQEMLGVSPELIETFGAVSIAVAWAMADGALKRSRADVAVAVTGVAGPGGGSDQKPVGTVVFAVARRDDPADGDGCNAESRLFDAAAGRSGIRRQAALVALELLLP